MMKTTKNAGSRPGLARLALPGSLFGIAAIAAASLSALPPAALAAAPGALAVPSAAGVPLPAAVQQPRAAAPRGGAAQPAIGVQLVAVTSAQIGAPMSGKLIQFALHDGDRFKKDDVLAEFQCDQQRANLLHASAEAAKRRSMLVTQQQLKELGTYSTLDYKVAGSELQAANADYALASATVALCTVKAPFSGRVSSAAAHNFQFVGVGTPLLEILDDSALETQMIAPSSTLAWLKPGMTFDVKIRETGKTYSAAVTGFSGRVDPVTQSIKVYGKISSPDAALLPGMSGEASLEQPAG